MSRSARDFVVGGLLLVGAVALLTAFHQATYHHPLALAWWGSGGVGNFTDDLALFAVGGIYSAFVHPHTHWGKRARATAARVEAVFEHHVREGNIPSEHVAHIDRIGHSIFRVRTHRPPD